MGRGSSLVNPDCESRTVGKDIRGFIMKRTALLLPMIFVPSISMSEVIDFKCVSRSYGDYEMSIQIDLAQGTAYDGIHPPLRIHTVNDRYFYWTDTSLDPASQKIVVKVYALNYQTGNLTRGQMVDGEPENSYMFNMECIRAT